MADRKPLVIVGGQVEQLQTGDKLPVSALASGTPDGTKFVADDGTLKSPGASSEAAANKALRALVFA